MCYTLAPPVLSQEFKEHKRSSLSWKTKAVDKKEKVVAKCVSPPFAINKYFIYSVISIGISFSYFRKSFVLQGKGKSVQKYLGRPFLRHF